MKSTRWKEKSRGLVYSTFTFPSTSYTAMEKGATFSTFSYVFKLITLIGSHRVFILLPEKVLFESMASYFLQARVCDSFEWCDGTKRHATEESNISASCVQFTTVSIAINSAFTWDLHHLHLGFCPNLPIHRLDRRIAYEFASVNIIMSGGNLEEIKDKWCLFM